MNMTNTNTIQVQVKKVVTETIDVLLPSYYTDGFIYIALITPISGICLMYSDLFLDIQHINSVPNIFLQNPQQFEPISKEVFDIIYRKAVDKFNKILQC